MRLLQDCSSVIMPTYQGQRFLGEALESIARSSIGELEVLVVDDGSTDDTIQIAKWFQSKMTLRILKPARRKNWVAMTNIGLEEASGSRCCILHQDDRWLPGRSQAHKDLSKQERPMVWMQTAMINESGQFVGEWRFPRAIRRHLHHPNDISPAASLFIQNWLSVPSVVFDTRLARDCGGLDESLWYTADWDLWFKLLRSGPPRLMSQVGSAFRVHREAQTITRSEDVDAFREQMNTVQARHSWAAETYRDADLLRRAAALSTETNTALAASLHRRSYGYSNWARSLVTARMAGLTCYLQNASLIDRLEPRVRLAVKRLLSNTVDQDYAGDCLSSASNPGPNSQMGLGQI
jgi:glycosyltransferase involved in cell wall biosynthesis